MNHIRIVQAKGRDNIRGPALLNVLRSHRSIRERVAEAYLNSDEKTWLTPPGCRHEIFVVFSSARLSVTTCDLDCRTIELFAETWFYALV